jgi:hypothetical protein
MADPIPPVPMIAVVMPKPPFRQSTQDGGPGIRRFLQTSLR